MTEFAFSGVGINPHYGTPGNPSTAERAFPAARPRARRSRSPTAWPSVGDRHRYRRLGAHSGGAVRHRRVQADAEARAARRRRAAVDDARFGRPAGPQRRLLRGHRRVMAGEPPTLPQPHRPSPGCASACRETLDARRLDADGRRRLRARLRGAVARRRPHRRATAARARANMARSMPRAASRRRGLCLASPS